jgi:predicted ATPase
LLSSVSIYGSFDTTLYSKTRHAVLPTREVKLAPNGSNLVALLNDLKQKDADAFKKIVEALHKVNENYVGIEFENITNKIDLKVKEKELTEAISAAHLSDGTLCFLCLLAILYNRNRGSLVCMDEPELGLHPDMITTLANAIKDTAETSQLIVTTHSEHILDAFDLENVRVVEKNEENATVVTKYSRTDFEGWYEEYLPGRMWRAGDIGGNRW